MSTPGDSDLGLQRERTSLAWSRTSLALVANGALLLVHRPDVLPRAATLVLGSLFVLLAAVTVWLSAVRSHWLLEEGYTRASRRLVPLGVVVLVLCAATLAVIAVGALG